MPKLLSQPLECFFSRFEEETIRSLLDKEFTIYIYINRSHLRSLFRFDFVAPTVQALKRLQYMAVDQNPGTLWTSKKPKTTMIAFCHPQKRHLFGCKLYNKNYSETTKNHDKTQEGKQKNSIKNPLKTPQKSSQRKSLFTLLRHVTFSTAKAPLPKMAQRASFMRPSSQTKAPPAVTTGGFRL